MSECGCPVIISAMKGIGTLLLWFVWLSAVSAAEVYLHEDKYGRKSFSDRPLGNNASKMYLTGSRGWVEHNPIRKRPSASGKAFDWRANQKRFDQEIRRLARQFNIPHTLVHAVITAESSYDPNAVSSAGAMGLMQLMPETARNYGVSNRRDPSQNMRAGVRYLSYLLGLFDNDLRLALAAYNAGENAVKSYGNRIPPYRETQRYVRKVLNFYQRYRKTMG